LQQKMMRHTSLSLSLSCPVVIVYMPVCGIH
jgi:hypothetical protein